MSRDLSRVSRDLKRDMSSLCYWPEPSSLCYWRARAGVNRALSAPKAHADVGPHWRS